MRKPRHTRLILAGCTGLAAVAATACHPVWSRLHASAPPAGAEGVPACLSAPDAFDWSATQVVARDLGPRQAEHARRRLLAYPDSSAAWAGGLRLEQLGCAPGDAVASAPAVAFPASGALVNKLFFLTREGSLLRVDRLNPASWTRLDLGVRFSRSAVTMSPFSTRAYLLADDGTLQVVDTSRMTVAATARVAGGYGMMPAIDRWASAPNDARDVLYVPASDGRVHTFVVTPSGTAPYVSIAAGPIHDVATSAVPVSGARKLAAPLLAIAGKLYVGDQAGNFRVHDTADPAASRVFAVGAPVNTAPAIVLQDGSYAPVDPDGQPKHVAYGEPVHAFVAAGAACAWVDLHALTTTFSPALRIDDHDPGRKHGYLLDYAFDTAGTTVKLAATDGGNLNTESPERPLPGYPTVWSNDHLVPAATNTWEEAGQARGGPIRSYVRFDAAGPPPAGALITGATLELTAAFDQACRIPSVRTTSTYFRGTSQSWSSDALSPATRPPVGAAAVGSFLSGAPNAAGNFMFKKRQRYRWDVTGSFSTPAGAYALALDQGEGDAVLWPEGPVGGGVGKKARRAGQVEAVKFVNNALNADPSPPSARDERPVLTLTLASTALPTPTLETPPLVDPAGRRVYVFYTNALYQLDFTSPAAFADMDPGGARHTLFNLAHLGDTANGGGGTHDGGRRFVANMTAPALSHDLTAAYVLDRYPEPDGQAPASWRYALTKLALPLDPAIDRRAASPPVFTGVPGEAGPALLLDPLNKLRTGGNVYFALGDGSLRQVEP